MVGTKKLFVVLVTLAALTPTDSLGTNGKIMALRKASTLPLMDRRYFGVGLKHGYEVYFIDIIRYDFLAEVFFYLRATVAGLAVSLLSACVVDFHSQQKMRVLLTGILERRYTNGPSCNFSFCFETAK